MKEDGALEEGDVIVVPDSQEFKFLTIVFIPIFSAIAIGHRHLQQGVSRRKPADAVLIVDPGLPGRRIPRRPLDRSSSSRRSLSACDLSRGHRALPSLSPNRGPMSGQVAAAEVRTPCLGARPRYGAGPDDACTPALRPAVARLHKLVERAGQHRQHFERPPSAQQILQEQNLELNRVLVPVGQLAGKQTRARPRPGVLRSLEASRPTNVLSVSPRPAASRNACAHRNYAGPAMGRAKKITNISASLSSTSRL